MKHLSENSQEVKEQPPQQIEKVGSEKKIKKTEIIGFPIFKIGSKLKDLRDGKEKTIVAFEYINMAVDKWILSDGSTTFSSEYKNHWIPL
jgi:hypothetical protein